MRDDARRLEYVQHRALEVDKRLRYDGVTNNFGKHTIQAALLLVLGFVNDEQPCNRNISRRYAVPTLDFVDDPRILQMHSELTKCRIAGLRIWA